MESKKHLFGTSEKSDFILNMTQETAQKLMGLFSIISMALLAVCALPYYLTKDMVKNVEQSDVGEVTHFYTENTVAIMSTVLIAVGFIGILMFLIARMKELTTLKGKWGLLTLALVTILSAVSVFTSGAVKNAFFGDSYRSDGYIEFLACIGFVAMGLIVTDDKWRRRFADTIIYIGTFEALFGIIQCISPKVPNFFAGLFIGFEPLEDTDTLVNGAYYINDTLCASGLMGSPFALSAVLTVCFAFAAAAAMYTKAGKKKIFYIIACGIMAAANILTHVFAGLVGIPAVLAVLLTVEIVRLATKHVLYKGKALENAVTSCIIVTVVTVLTFAGLKIGGLTKLHDEKVLFTDTFVRLSTSFHDRTNTDPIYEDLRHQGISKIQAELDNGDLFGVGQDCTDSLLDNNFRTDRVYNDYLDFILQRGIITFVSYCLFLLYALWCGIKAAAAFIRKEQPYYAAAALAGLVGYLVNMFWNTSSHSSTQYMYLCIGMLILYAEKKELSPKAKRQKEKYKN